MSNFVIQTSHPIQKRAQTYILDRKILSIHSYDRDISKWPHSNHFEIDLPEAVTNIQSIRLVQMSIPSNQFVFSNEYQNTKLSFEHDTGGAAVSYTITISEGSYTASELATEIQTKMNEAAYFSPPAVLSENDCYICKYNDIQNTFWFGNTGRSFTLLFSKQETYNVVCNQPIVWNNHIRWGLPAYLGYERKDYIATITSNNGSGFVVGATGTSYGFTYEWNKDAISPKFNVWLGNGETGPTGPFNAHIVDASGNCQIDIFGEQAIYMELDKFNTIDEVSPYSTNSMGVYNNDYSGKVKAAFAKIPILQTQFTQQTDNINNNLMNISHFEPAIERIDRLRFKFRYHDGRLVDFRCVPFNFSIEFNCLRDRQDKNMAIFVPPLYNV